jgi:hypothetical protein
MQRAGDASQVESGGAAIDRQDPGGGESGNAGINSLSIEAIRYLKELESWSPHRIGEITQTGARARGCSMARESIVQPSCRTAPKSEVNVRRGGINRRFSESIRAGRSQFD